MNNWFLLDTDGSPTWAPLEGNAAAPSVGTLRVVGQQPSATLEGAAVALPGSGTLRVIGAAPSVIGEFVIDGGGTIVYFAERDLTATYQLYGWVAADLTVTYQIVAIAAPSTGTVRLVGAAPTLAVSGITFALPSVGTLRVVGQQPSAAYTGDLTAAPVTGALRFVGQVPSLDPKVVSPTVGSLRFVGQQIPLVDLGHKVATPTVGTLRVRALGAVERDLTVTWQDFALAVQSDLTAVWQRAAYLTSDLSPTWQIFGQVSSITLLAQRSEMMLEAPSTAIELDDARYEIELLAA